MAGELRRRLKLKEPYADPGVAHFGLRNAVFTLGDTFLEVVSPVEPDTAAGRLIERRGGDCGYMLMFQVEDLEGARSRAAEQGVREVFEVALDDISEVHLHPGDMRAAIVSLSQPEPPESWRWGGPQWEARAASVGLAGATIAVAQPVAVAARWEVILGAETNDVGVMVSADEDERGLTEILIEGLDSEFVLAGVRFAPSDYEEE